MTRAHIKVLFACECERMLASVYERLMCVLVCVFMCPCVGKYLHNVICVCVCVSRGVCWLVCVCVCVCLWPCFPPPLRAGAPFCAKQPPVMTDTSRGQESKLRRGSSVTQHAKQPTNWILLSLERGIGWSRAVRLCHELSIFKSGMQRT